MSAEHPRTWSCSTLMRGSSFLDEQRAAHKTMSFDEIVGVPKMQEFLHMIPMYSLSIVYAVSTIYIYIFIEIWIEF